MSSLSHVPPAIVNSKPFQPIASDPAGDLLIVAPSRWDEACFAVPAVRAFRKSGWNTTLLCVEGQREFWQSLPGLTIFPIDARESARALGKRLAGRWKCAIVWEPGRLANAVRMARIPHTVGPSSEAWAKWVSAPAPLAPPPKFHRVEYYLATARVLGLDTGDPELFEPAFQRNWEHPLLLIPGSDFGESHQWPFERWVELAGRLRDAGRTFHLAVPENGGSRFAELSEPSGATLIELPVTANAPVILSHYRLVIAADGSLPHFASHAGATCLTLFGPNDPVSRRPLGRRHRMVRHHVECAPCSLPTCSLDLRCQHELVVGRVWKSITEWPAFSEFP